MTTGWSFGAVCGHCGSSILEARGPRKYCSDCTPTQDAWRRLNLYGLSQFEFDSMYFDQGGECAMPGCLREAKAVDHCHKTGKVRALLCISCNADLGKYESAEWRAPKDEYLKEYGYGNSQ